MRWSTRLLRSITTPPPPVVHTTPLSPLTYSLGLSYASKNSPPFVDPGSRPVQTGFAGQGHKVGKWVGEMMSLRAGRGDLAGSLESNAEGVRAWGAGEDFFGIVEAGGGWTHLAVSDGVGGWAPRYDPSFFSQSLMYHYSLSAISKPSSSPEYHLQAAYDGVSADSLVEAGSATAVGVSLSGNGDLKGVNLGDSGLTILRRGAVVFETKVQTHYFNCPLQLSKVPESMRQEGNITDLPSSADKFKFYLEPNDLVLIYTDGLSDNLPEAHLPLLSEAVDRTLETPDNAHLEPADRASERARLLADVLVGYGRMAMARTGQEDGGKGWKTPFEIEAKRNGYDYKGGKVDDITVLTAVVSERLTG